MPFGPKRIAAVDKLTIRKPNSSDYTNIIAAAGSGYTLTLPSSIEDGKMLKTDASGVLSWGESHKALLTPLDNNDATSKSYVDAKIESESQGLHVLTPVMVATSSELKTQNLR